MNRTDRRRRLTAPQLALAVVAAAAFIAGTAPAASAAPVAPVQAPPPTCSVPLSGDGGLAPALTWLRCELEVNDYGFPGYEGSVDGGSTLDAVMALSLNGQADDPTTVAALARVEAEIGGYVGTGDEHYAGALAKSLLAVQLQGSDPHDFGGFDLEADLRAGLELTDVDAGRFSDRSEYGNYSNGFGQALAILGLSRTDSGIPTAAIDFLLDQQCPGGGFRGSYDVSGGCTSAGDADTDYTAFALQALLASPQTAAVQSGIVEARTWLLDKQDVSGAFAGTGVTAEPNANTTGIAAQALRAAGDTAAADHAAAWLITVQLTTANADGTPAAAELGAIAYNAGARDDAVAGGIPAISRDQWRRSIVQASLGFAAGPYGAPPADLPTTTTTSTTTTSTTSTTTTTAPTTSTTAPTTSTTEVAPTTTPITPSTVVGGDGGDDGQVDPGGINNVRDNSNSYDNRSSRNGGTLPATGSETSGLMTAGLVLLVAGAVLILGTRRRTARSL